ncbi:MAG: Gfo/Idh/MocA family oxidoreductase [Bacteroidales bacterium]|nr:Gfo/Idh/MocA family oxidoreductase [Bacteroidales bacterium]
MQKIGIIGCGKIAQVRHIPELARNPKAKIVGYYNPTTSRAEQMAAQYGGKVYPTIEEMLADPEIDAVVMSLANQVHAEVTIKALNAGKAILCEKPMANTIEECEAMVKAAKDNGKPLMIAQNQRLTKAHMCARELIEKGEIGKVITFRTTFGHSGPENWSVNPGKGTWFFNKQKASLGAMADLGIHKTDLIQFLLGQNVTSVKATLATVDKTDEAGSPISVEDNAICIYTMSEGTIGTMTASWTYYGQEDNSTVLYGTKGIMKIYDRPEEYAIEIIKPGQESQKLDIEPIQTNDNQTASGMTDLFVDILEGTDKESLAKNDFFLSGESLLPAMRAIFAAVKSSSEGIAVDIPENK